MRIFDYGRYIEEVLLQRNLKFTIDGFMTERGKVGSGGIYLLKLTVRC